MASVLSFFVRFFFIWFSRERERPYTKNIVHVNRWKKGKKKRKSAKRKKEKIWREQTRVTRFYFFGRVAYTRRLSRSTVFFFQEKSLFTLYYLVRRVFSWTHAKQKQKVKARIELSKRCVLHASFNALLLLLVLLLSPSVEEISLCEPF